MTRTCAGTGAAKPVPMNAPTPSPAQLPLKDQDVPAELILAAVALLKLAIETVSTDEDAP